MQVRIQQPRVVRIRRQYVQPSPRGQITLPIAVRRALAIDPETLLDVSVDRDRVILSPIRSTASSRGYRVYSDIETDEFLENDQISNADRRFVDRLLKRA